MDERVVGTRGQIGNYPELSIACLEYAPDVLRIFLPFASRYVDREKPNLCHLERPATGDATLGVMTDLPYNFDSVPLIEASSIGIASEFGILDTEMVLPAPVVDRAVEGIVVTCPPDFNPT